MNFSLRALLLSLSLNVVFAAPAAFAQTDRFELGQRLRACEAAWETQYNAETRRTAVKHLQQAVQLFFGLKLNDAAQALDAARLTMRWPNEPTPFARWAESVFLKPESHLIDAADTALPFTLTTAYLDTSGIQPREPVLRVSLWRGQQSQGKAYETKLSKLPLTDKLPLKNLGNGDYTLRCEILLNGKLLALSEQTLSAVNQLRERLDRLQLATGALRQISTDAETARALVKLLDQLAQKQTPETNFPAARLLAEAENLLLKARIGQDFYGQRKPGQFWLTLSLASGTVPVRILAPATVQTGKRLPLVLALHGAGGSENLFFDVYGVGKIAQLGESRGWLIVAPRGAAGFSPQRTGEIIDAVDKLYPVDRQRVFLVGHSMGAAQAVASAQATPTRFAGVAALGGGGMVKETEGLNTVPFFIAVGAQDFAYSTARKLAFELKKAGVNSVRFKEYPDVEHLIIVQEALPDVFAFFDDLAQR
jgi:predicted esterase